MNPARDFGRGDSARMYSLRGDCLAGLGTGVLLRTGRSSVSCILNFCVERPGDRGSVGRIFAGGRIMEGGGFFIGLGFFGGDGGGDVPTPIDTICGRSGTGSFVRPLFFKNLSRLIDNSSRLLCFTTQIESPGILYPFSWT